MTLWAGATREETGGRAAYRSEVVASTVPVRQVRPLNSPRHTSSPRTSWTSEASKRSGLKSGLSIEP